MRYKYILLVLVVPLFSCQKFHEFQVSSVDGNLVFSHLEFLKECTSGLIVQDFGIELENGDNSKVVWLLVRNETEKMEKHVFNFPLVYGAKVDGVITRTSPVPLKMGKYNIGAILACITAGEIEPLTFMGVFNIDGSGRLISE